LVLINSSQEFFVPAIETYLGGLIVEPKVVEVNIDGDRRLNIPHTLDEKSGNVKAIVGLESGAGIDEIFDEALRPAACPTRGRGGGWSRRLMARTSFAMLIIQRHLLLGVFVQE